MAHRPARAVIKQKIQSRGVFTGMAQAGPARPKRAHALAEELLTRGCMYIEKQVWDEAAREFRKAVKMETDYAEAWNNLGLAMLYLNKPQEAMEALEGALEHLPGWYIAEANLGLALQRLHRHDEALSYFKKAVLKKQQSTLYLSIGDSLSALKKFDEAMEAYEQAVALSPDDDQAHHRIGMLHARRNDLDAAEKSLQHAVEIEPENAEAIAVLGAIAARRGDLNQARDNFVKVQDAHPVPTPAKKGLERLQTFRAGLKQGFSEWTSAMPATTPVAVCYYNLGLAHFAAGNQPAAKEAFQNAIDAQPNWAEPLIWFGFFAALDGDGLSARRYWESASKVRPRDAALRLQLGYLAVAMGLQKEADTWFQTAANMGLKIPEKMIESE